MTKADTRWSKAIERHERAMAVGFALRGEPSGQGYRPKPGCHDDGGAHGPFLGGLGTVNFSRDLYGGFSRWHLQPGYHIVGTIPQARFLLYSRNGEDNAACRWAGIGDPPGWDTYSPSFSGFDASSREYSVLFPECNELYRDPSLPYELLLRSWSPLLFGDDDASLPVVVHSVLVRNHTGEKIEVSAALFWPNLLGWRQSRVTSLDRGDVAWPGQTHMNNVNREIGDSRLTPEGRGIVQSRIPPIPARRDMEGEILLYVLGPTGASYTTEICFKSDQNAIGVPPSGQMFTQAWVEEHFAANGKLPETGKSWPAHWHEPLSSAISCSVGLDPGESKEITFMQVFDLPLAVFGSERAWTRRYTRDFGSSGGNSEAICAYAKDKKSLWEDRIAAQQDQFLHKTRLTSDKVDGALLNELFFLTAGGAVWTEKMKPDDGASTPTLGAGEHFALLEGYDTGYFYYNTFDLWVYAFPALASTWPHLADLVFIDHLKSANRPNLQKRIVYRVMEERQVSARGKVPHDIGTPMGDPWNEINGYTMRDDPNNWRDHNPAMIIAYYLFAKSSGREIEKWKWDTLKTIGQYMLDQDSDGDGLPEHLEYGDSTWDNLRYEGIGGFTGGLTLAAYAVMIELSDRFGESDLNSSYRKKLEIATSAYESALWSGSFYRTTSAGPYADRLTIESIMGPFFADLAGLGPILPKERVRRHLATAYEKNFLGYAHGNAGPLLVVSSKTHELAPDDGEDLQVNEVLVGAAWTFCAMLKYYGLPEEADRVGSSLVRIQYCESGLQFRTPAAWDAKGQFRAPLNMRPLSIWLLNWTS